VSLCCYDDYEPAAVHDELWRVARKQHKCCECHGQIKKGDTYQFISQLQGGTWYKYKTCEPCADLRDSLEYVDCPYYEGLSECYVNWLVESPHTVMCVRAGTHAATLVPGYMVYEEGEDDG
jgi:hypothetical protein